MFSLASVFNWILAVLALSFLTSVSHALRMEGDVVKLNNKVYLRDASSKRYELEISSGSMEIIIGRLKTRDFISVEGTYNAEEETIEVRSINFVGLQQLLGRWSDSDGFCYSFENFKTLKIYRMTAIRTCVFTDAFVNRTMSYTINPANENWLMLLSDSRESFILDLVLKNKKNAQMVLYDPETADIIRNIGLERLP